MSKKQHKMYYIFGILLGIIIGIGFLKYFNLYWVESNTAYTKVTINFLFPIRQANFTEHIQVIGEGDIAYQSHWINAHTVELILKEKGEIKGQKAVLKINHLPTQYNGLDKSVSIPIQFKADIQLASSNQFLISSTGSFTIAFNTPITVQQLYKSIQCEAEFDIKPYDTDCTTQFIFTPKKTLENGKIYILRFLAGMRAKSGTLLKENQTILLAVDQKPTITKTYPVNGDKWIGLYPRLLLESQEDIVNAKAYINGVIIDGTLIDSKHAYFLLDDLLQPEKNYDLSFQIQTASGELSDMRQVRFTTTTLNDKRFWLDIHIGNTKEIRCYEENKRIRTIPFEMSKEVSNLLLGTYYLQGTSEVYEDSENHLGGNYWICISNQLGIQGTLRDAYWQPINDISHAKNMIITDEEAHWLYEKVTSDTMIIIRR